MTNLKKILSIAVLALSGTAIFAQNQYAKYPVFKHLDALDKQIVPEDTALRHGVLDNGFTYYVCQSKDPANRAFFQLLVKGGSVIEKDNERGIAHFVEHMMFKGTKHFPGQEVIGFMSRNGIPFGHDSNAFTGFNTVRYLLNSIPTNNEQLVDSCLLLLRDWAGDATIDKKDVESEHNVIVEEWRGSNVYSFSQQMQNDLFNNSIYTQRIPIGDMNVVQNCSARLVKDFYKRWYQPQNQAIVVVGDFDADEMVEKVRRMFGNMKRGKNFAPAQPIIPDFDTPKISFYKEPKLPYVLNALLIRTTVPEADIKTVGGQRTQWMRNKIKDILNEKMKTINENNKDMLEVNSLYMDLGDVANNKFYMIGFGSKDVDSKKAYELLAKQIELIRRKGFKDEDWKEQFLHIPHIYNEDSTSFVFADSTLTGDYLNNNDSRYVSSFFAGTPSFSQVDKKAIDEHIKCSMSEEQLRKEFNKIFSGKNMVIAPISPEGTTLPSEAELLEVFDRVKNMSDEELSSIDYVKAKKFEHLNVDSIEITTVPGTLKKMKVLNDSISEAYLSNGVKVVFWKHKMISDDNDGRLNFMFRRPSGFSVLKDNEIFYSGMLSSCVRHYEFCNGMAPVSVGPFEDSLDHNLRDREKLESIMRFFYSSLTMTEVDSVAFAEELHKLETSAISASNPLQQSAYKVSFLPSESKERLCPPTMENLVNYNIDNFRKVVEEYYSNYNGSTLIIQGDVNADSIMPLILKYIAALPSKAEPVKRMTWSADHYKTTNSTIVETIQNPSPISLTYLFYTWEKGFKYTQESHAHNQVLQSVLGNILLNTLRVQHSDVYTPSCQVSDDLLPINRMKVTIAYSCNPTQRERIAKDVQQILHDMANGNLITQALIDNYIKAYEKSVEHFKPNDFSLRRDYLIREQDGIVIDMGDTSFIKKVTPASLKTYVKQLISKGNVHVGYLTTE